MCIGVCRPTSMSSAFRRVSCVYTSLDLKDVRMLSATRAEVLKDVQKPSSHQTFLPPFPENISGANLCELANYSLKFQLESCVDASFVSFRYNEPHLHIIVFSVRKLHANV